MEEGASLGHLGRALVDARKKSTQLLVQLVECKNATLRPIEVDVTLLSVRCLLVDCDFADQQALLNRTDLIIKSETVLVHSVRARANRAPISGRHA